MGRGRRAHRALRDAADFAIYTPGSTAGLPVSILALVRRAAAAVREDEELLRERVASTVTTLLALVGIDADPLQSREHILISTLLSRRVGEGRGPRSARADRADPDAGVARIGVVDLESFFPSKDRFDLAMRLNNLLAAPGFADVAGGRAARHRRDCCTRRGQAADRDLLDRAPLATPSACSSCRCCSTRSLGWMRAQSGTTSLRAILYMDEIFGYFPPVADPPSKAPLLTLLKQARAFGLGVVLATQNPVDLDYKGLANTGTWFLGRLQTERDKARVLEGLEGAPRRRKALRPRRDGADAVGPRQPRLPAEQRPRGRARGLRDALGDVVPARPADPPADQDADGWRGASMAGDEPPARKGKAATPATPPPRAGRVPSCRPACRSSSFPSAVRPRSRAQLYRPVVLAQAEVHFADAKTGVSTTEKVARLASIADPPDWASAVEPDFAPEDLESEPAKGATFSDPGGSVAAKSAELWAKDFATWLYREKTLVVLRSPSTREFSKPGETEAEFRARLQQGSRETRDAALDRLREKYGASGGAAGAAAPGAAGGGPGEAGGHPGRHPDGDLGRGDRPGRVVRAQDDLVHHDRPRDDGGPHGGTHHEAGGRRGSGERDGGGGRAADRRSRRGASDGARGGAVGRRPGQREARERDAEAQEGGRDGAEGRRWCGAWKPSVPTRAGGFPAPARRSSASGRRPS